MPKLEKISSSIEGFDDALGGGIPAGNVVMVYGTAGTMKSSLCFNVLYNEIVKGKKGVYISIEQNSLSLLKQMVGMNFDISKINIEVLNDADDIIKGISKLKEAEEKKLTLIDFGSIRKELKSKVKGKTRLKDTENFAFSEDMIHTLLEIASTLSRKNLCDILIIDSLTAIYSLTELKNPRNEIFFLCESLRDLGVTSFLISEDTQSKNSVSAFNFGVESYLVDGIIHLQLTERNRKVTREISIPKMRHTACINDVYTMEFNGKKFKALYGGKMPLI